MTLVINNRNAEVELRSFVSKTGRNGIPFFSDAALRRSPPFVKVTYLDALIFERDRVIKKLR